MLLQTNTSKNEFEVMFEHLPKPATILYNEENDEYMIDARSVCFGLGITETKDGVMHPMYRRLSSYLVENEIDDAVFGTSCRKSKKQSNNQRVTKDSFISERAFYQVAMVVNNEVGKRFRYIIAKYLVEQRKARSKAMNEQIQQLQTQNISMTHTITDCIHNKDCYITSEVAEYSGFKSPQQLNNFLQEIHIIKKMNNTWLVCAEYADKGYFIPNKHSFNDDGTIAYDGRWTFLGREFCKDVANRMRASLGVRKFKPIF